MLTNEISVQDNFLHSAEFPPFLFVLDFDPDPFDSPPPMIIRSVQTCSGISWIGWQLSGDCLAAGQFCILLLSRTSLRLAPCSASGPVHVPVSTNALNATSEAYIFFMYTISQVHWSWHADIVSDLVSLRLGYTLHSNISKAICFNSTVLNCVLANAALLRCFRRPFSYFIPRSEVTLLNANGSILCTVVSVKVSCSCVLIFQNA